MGSGVNWRRLRGGLGEAALLPMAGAPEAMDDADFAGTGGTAAAGDVPAVPPPMSTEDDLSDWDVVSHTLWSIIPGVIIIVAVVLCMLEFLGLRGSEANPVATGRKPQILCIILLGSGGASAPLIKALLDLQHANAFRVFGDMLHNFATVFILCKVVSQRSVAGAHAASVGQSRLPSDRWLVRLLLTHQGCHGIRPACTHWFSPPVISTL